MSVYEQLGEERGIRAAVDDFYDRVLGDPTLAPFFEGVDVARVRAHQAKLLVQVTGGPAGYEGRDLGVAHARLGIGDDDFDRVVGHLVATLTGMGVDDATIGVIGEALGAHRGAIVTAPATESVPAR